MAARNPISVGSAVNRPASPFETGVFRVIFVTVCLAVDAQLSGNIRDWCATTSERGDYAQTVWGTKLLVLAYRFLQESFGIADHAKFLAPPYDKFKRSVGIEKVQRSPKLE